MYLFDVMCDGTSISRFLWNNDPTTFWTMLQAVGVVGTLLFISRQLNAQVNQSISQSEQVSAQRIGNMLSYLTALEQKWESPEYAKARRTLCQEFLDGNTEVKNRETFLLLAFFEDLGVYNRLKAFDVEILWSMFSERILLYGRLCSDKIANYRTITGDNDFYVNFETMVEAISAYGRRSVPSFRKRTDDEVREFAESEVANINRRKEKGEL